MVEESKPHTRNLKLISMCFILYWLLGLEPLNEEIQLPMVSYKITNSEPLVWIAWFALVYFFWRFILAIKGGLRDRYREIWRESLQPLNQKTFRKVSLCDEEFNDIDPAFCASNLKPLIQELYQGFCDKRKTEFENSIRENNRRRERPYRGYELVLRIGSIQPKGKISLAVGTQLFPTADRESGRGSDISIEVPVKKIRAIKYKVITELLFRTEESPDFIMPIVLALGALTSGVLVYFDIPPLF